MLCLVFYCKIIIKLTDAVSNQNKILRVEFNSLVELELTQGKVQFVT